MSEPERIRWPGYIIGSMRSGSTLLRHLLDSHESLACPPESRFLVALQDFLDAPYVMVALSGLGCTSESLRNNLQQFVHGFLDIYPKQAGKTRWIDKSPNYYQILPFIEKIFAGNVLYLVIVRHPLDCIASLEEAFPNASKHNRDPEIARIVDLWGKGRYGWARYWIDVYERTHLFCSSIPDRTHVIRYEDLVTNPESVMSSAVSFLGEDPGSLRLQETFSKKESGGLQDQKFRNTSGIHRNSVSRWKAWPANETRALWDMVEHVAGKYGYSLS